VKEAQKRLELMPRAFYGQLQPQSRPNAPTPVRMSKFEAWLCPKERRVNAALAQYLHRRWVRTADYLHG
jgi:hypothetical protein